MLRQLLQLSAVVAVLLAVTCPQRVNSGCAAAGRCCQGKDNDCMGVDDSSNFLPAAEHSSNRTKKACFCDVACIDIGDCCADYKQHCPAVDCVVADDWMSWSDCSVRCGFGTHHRTRRIVRSPQNGGRPCPLTTQKAICYGANCKQTRAQNNIEMRETARLLPASLGQWRRSKVYNPNLDIRKNLFEKQNDIQSSLNRPSYCAVYELTAVKSTCSLLPKNAPTQQQQQPWTLNMTLGAHVCAECQPTAMQSKLGGRCKGAGIHRRETPWMALGEGVTGCHGSWVMKTKQEECRCNNPRMLNLILV